MNPALKELRRRIEASSLTEVSKELGFSPAMISQVANGHWEMTDRLANSLGFKRECEWVEL